jgi:hypothetical protein
LNESPSVSRFPIFRLFCLNRNSFFNRFSSVLLIVEMFYALTFDSHLKIEIR